MEDLMVNKGTINLETGRLLLRRFTPGDAEQMYRNWASDPEVTKYLTWQPHSDPGETRRILEQWSEDYRREDYYQWGIVLKDEGELIGSIAVVNAVDPVLRAANVGFCIGKKWWRQGMTAEALRRVIDFLFDEAGMNRVAAYHDANNPASGAVMRKCGMRFEGILRQSERNNQGICDACWYSITAGERRGNSPDRSWEALYSAAKAVQNDRSISRYIEAGSVAAAVQSRSGRIYTGVCIDTCSTLGICAERNAIFSMVTAGEQEISRVLAIMPDGKSGAPCGACRELMVQLMPEKYKDIEIMMDYETGRVITLGEITPEWWI